MVVKKARKRGSVLVRENDIDLYLARLYVRVLNIGL